MRCLHPLFMGAALAFSGSACAHLGSAEAVGFSDGFLHPFMGFDHLLTMMGLGLWALSWSRKTALWLPLAALAAILLGIQASRLGLIVPVAEAGIQVSLLMIGFLLCVTLHVKVFPAALAAGFFAFFHGYVHGQELLTQANGLAVASGLLSSSAVLIGLGMMLGLSAHEQHGEKLWIKGFGALCAGAGAYWLMAG